MKVSELKKLLRRHGCTLQREGSGHEIWYSPATGKHFTVPRHNAHDLPLGTASSIKRSAGLK